MAGRVLLLNTVAGKGSVGRIVTGIASLLKAGGNECLIAYGRWDPPPGFDVYRIGSDPEVIIHGALSRITDRHGLYSASATRRLIRKIREFDPDIIHIHNVHGYYVNYKLLFSFLKNEYSKKPGHRIIWTLHDCWSFTGHCVHFEYAGCDKWKTGCYECPEKGQYPSSLLMDASRSNYKLKKEVFSGINSLSIVTPSEWLKGKVSESFLREYPVRTVPTGIDLEVFRPRESSIRDRFGIGKRVLLLGAANPWRERKGLDDFKELARRSRGVVIAMIGLNKKQVKELSLFKNIIPLMKTDSLQEMVEWYSAADIYVNLTREDTFPTTNLEAMACGTPVITYRAGGSPESLTEETGAVTEKGDIPGVINAISALLSRLSVAGEEIKNACVERASLYGSEIRFREYIDEIYGIR